MASVYVGRSSRRKLCHSWNQPFSPLSFQDVSLTNMKRDKNRRKTGLRPLSRMIVTGKHEKSLKFLYKYVCLSRNLRAFSHKISSVGGFRKKRPSHVGLTQEGRFLEFCQIILGRYSASTVGRFSMRWTTDRMKAPYISFSSPQPMKARWSLDSSGILYQMPGLQFSMPG